MLLADPDVQADTDRFRDLSRELAQVEPVSTCYARYRAAESELRKALAEFESAARRVIDGEADLFGVTSEFLELDRVKPSTVAVKTGD